jgi:hypothetical protein
VSYFFHYVKFAKEDGQGLRGSHLSLLFQASQGRKTIKRDILHSPPKGSKTAHTLHRAPRSPLSCLIFQDVSKLPGRLAKIGVKKTFLEIFLFSFIPL